MNTSPVSLLRAALAFGALSLIASPFAAAQPDSEPQASLDFNAISNPEAAIQAAPAVGGATLPGLNDPQAAQAIFLPEPFRAGVIPDGFGASLGLRNNSGLAPAPEGMGSGIQLRYVPSAMDQE